MTFFDVLYIFNYNGYYSGLTYERLGELSTCLTYYHSSVLLALFSVFGEFAQELMHTSRWNIIKYGST